MASGTIAEALAQADKHRAAGDPGRAEAICRAVVAAAPKCAPAWCRLADVYKAQDRPADAADCYRKALAAEPNQPSVHNSLGILYARRRDYAAAEVSFRNALRLQPDHAKAFNNLGNVLSELGKTAEAVTAYRQAYHLGYRDPLLHDNLAQMHHRGGDPRAEEAQLQKALRAKPDDPDLLKRLGSALVAQVQFDPAIACFRRAVRLRADDADAHWRLGDAYSGQGSLDRAIDSLKTAVRLKPDEANYHHHLGAAYMTLGELAEAQACFRRGIELAPANDRLHSSLLFALCYDPDADPAAVLAEHRRWADRHAPAGPTPVHANDRTPGRRLRVGYVSPDFRGHPVGRFIEPALVNHDPAQVEVFCYDEFQRPPDPLTARQQAKVKNWRNVRGLSDEKLAEQVRADGIDVLVDLAGHTASHRLKAFALKPAPVQVTYLGYPNTTGVPAIDYLLTDAVADPRDRPCYLTEEPVRLPTGFCCFLPRTDVPDVSPLPAAKNGYVTFGSLHGQSKLNGKVIDLWAAVLKAVPAAKLLFARHTMAGEARDRLVRMFAARGVAGDRLRFRQLAAGTGEYWTVYGDVDISLDPFPWTGHTTSCESLWMGVPVVTLFGQAHAGRMVASVLAHAGLHDWVAETPQGYVGLAKQWAGRLPELATLRAGMRDRLKKSDLCNAVGFARGLEEAYRAMWRRWCERPAPVPRDETRTVTLLAQAEQARQAGDWPRAERHFRELLDADPGCVDGRTAFGDACKAAGNWADAADHYRKALDLRPQVPRTWNSLGIALANLRKFAECEAAFRRVVELDPDHAKGFNNLGNALAELGRPDDAVAAWREAHRLGHSDAPLHENLANLLFRRGDYAEAEAHFRRLLRHRPDDPPALRKLAELLAKRSEYDAAVELLNRLIALDPKDADARWRLGNVLTEQGNLGHAARCYRDALAVKPDHAPYLHHLGTALMMAGRIAEATDCYRKAMAAMPDNKLSHASLLFVLCYDPAADPAAVFAEHKRWGELYATPKDPAPTFLNDRAPDRRLRVGYVSPDFRGHPVGRFIEPVIAHHDPAQVELFCYDEYLRPPDPLTARLQAKVKHWRNTRGRPDDEVAAQVRADGIDVLVDLAGHTGSNRIGLFARRAAPVQVTYLGYPNTTGVPAMDYVLTDAVADPESEPWYFTEHPVRLPTGFACFRPRDNAPDVTPLPALANGHLTFGCTHNQGKLNGRVLDLWAEVLKAVPGSKLLFARHTLTDEARADLLELFAARGIGADRLAFRRPTAMTGNFLGVYQEIDVSLDPFPWTGHTTACESLWQGVPSITLRGRAHAGQMVASVLTHAGLPDWIAETSEQYVELAKVWAGRLDELAALRAGMRDRLRSAPLCDAVEFTRGLEAAYRRMWRAWCA